MKNNSQDYWKSRMDEIFASTDKTDLEFFDELQQIYSEANQEIRKELFNFFTKYAKDNNITYQEAQNKLFREDLSDYKANAKKYFESAEDDSELLKRLNEQYASGRVSRLKALELDLDYKLGVMSGKLHKSFDSYLKDVAKFAYRKLSNDNSRSSLNKKVLEQLVNTPFNGKNYSQSVWGNVDTLSDELKKALKRGFIRGSGPAEIARDLKKKFNVSRARAEAIIRTDGTNVINNATILRFKEFGLTRYQFHAHIDSRTTEICKSLTNKIFDIAEYLPGTNAPPMHVNCRSTIVPADEEIGIEKSAKEKAQDMLEKAEDAEPKITLDLKEITSEVGANLEGLEFRLKTLDSLTRKISNEPNAKMRDVVRYTSISSDELLVEQYNQIVDKLLNKGYNKSAVKNYWLSDGNPYNGVNCNFISPNGYEFELQFHTPESFELKNGKLHELYEEFRILDGLSIEALNINKEMFKLSNKLKRPKNIDKLKGE